jgi:hypothetical protein
MKTSNKQILSFVLTGFLAFAPGVNPIQFELIIQSGKKLSEGKREG